MSPERLNQRIAAKRRLNEAMKMQQTFSNPELDQIVLELTEELRRKESEPCGT